MTGVIWLPQWTRVDLGGPDGDPYAHEQNIKILWHTWEGSNFAAAESAFRAYPPHVAKKIGEKPHQYVPLDEHAYALLGSRNEGEFVIQVELAGFARDVRDWSTDILDEIADDVLEPILYFHDVPDWHPPFYDEQDGITLASPTSPIRFGFTQWTQISGHVGHQHAPAPDCVVPDTPILCADLEWRAAGDLVAGDQLIGVEEEASTRWGRKMLTASVERNWIGPKDCARVITARGDVVASLDHPWLARDLRVHRGSRYRWVPTHALDPEYHEIVWYTEPWRVDRSWAAGWLAGLYDADGSLMLNHRDGHGFVTLAFSQVAGPLADEFVAEMTKRGFNVSIHHHRSRGLGREDVRKSAPVVCSDIRIKGGRFEIMRALGSLRPRRLLRHPRFSMLWDGRYLHKTTQAQDLGGTATVVAVERVGEREVASLSTSSRTYIAGGLVCHNTHWDPGCLDVDYMIRRARRAGHQAHQPKGDDVALVAYYCKRSDQTQVWVAGSASRPFKVSGAAGGFDQARKRAFAMGIQLNEEAPAGTAKLIPITIPKPDGTPETHQAWEIGPGDAAEFGL